MTEMMFISGKAGEKLPEGKAESSPAVWSMAEARALHKRSRSGLSFRAWARSGVFRGKAVTGKLGRILAGGAEVGR